MPRPRFLGNLAKELPDGVRAGRRVLSDADRVAYVHRMFSAIARRYDRTNTVISAGLHTVWKRRTVAALGLRLGERTLDLCCGTGDLARMMAEVVGPDGRVVGADFASPMIAQARRLVEVRRARARRRAPASFLVADAMRLPFAPATFDAVTVGFGLRNVADPAVALREIARVLQPGGRLAILEFARVSNPVLRALYDLYSFTLMAVLGRLVSGHPDAYWYLPVSVRHWLDQAALLRLLGATGFHRAGYQNQAGGIVAIYRAEKAGEAGAA